MKKACVLTALVLAASLLAACGSGSTQTETTEAVETTTAAETTAAEETTEAETETYADETSLEGILLIMTTDFEETQDAILADLADTLDVVGDTYESYVENRQELFDWYERTQDALTGLYERTIENSVAYYRLASQYNNPDDREALDEALDVLYDAILDEAMDSLYDNILEDGLDVAYEYYCADDAILDSGYSSADSEEWWDLYFEFDDVYWDAYDSMSDDWWDAWDILDDLYWAVWNGFLDDNYDIDAILAEMEEEKLEEAEEELEEAEEEAEDEETEEAQENPADGMRPEFKEAMDGFEEYFDGYCEFMIEFAASDGTDSSLMTDYLNYMSSYADVMEELEEWAEGDMTAEELAYYLEVTERITQKLLDTADAMS